MAIRIAPDPDTATKEHDLKAAQSLSIYTDGSGYEGHVGAGAVAPSLDIKRRKYIGTENNATIFAGEL